MSDDVLLVPDDETPMYVWYYLTMEAILPNMTNVFKLIASGMLIWVTQQMLINSYPRFPKSKLRLEIKVLKKADLLVLFVNVQRPTL